MSRVVPARLPLDLARGLEQQVRSGRYRNRSEVIKEATRLFLSSGGRSRASAAAMTASRAASLMIAWNVPEVEAISLYGSVARGEASSQSDIDLLVVVGRGEAWRVRRRLYELIYPLMAGLEVDISLLVVTRTGWNEMVAGNDPVALSILEEGKPLWGGLARQA